MGAGREEVTLLESDSFRLRGGDAIEAHREVPWLFVAKLSRAAGTRPVRADVDPVGGVYSFGRLKDVELSCSARKADNRDASFLAYGGNQNGFQSSRVAQGLAGVRRGG